MAELKKEKELTNVVSYWDTGSPDLRSRDGREAMVLAHVTGDETQQRENAKKILDTYTGTHKGALTVQAGAAPRSATTCRNRWSTIWSWPRP